MAQSNASEPIRRELNVSVPIDRAFAVFTDGFATWWPREFTWAGDVLETIAIEPHEGGRCYERGPYAFTCDWGRVLAWDPPGRLVFTWQISPTRVPEPDPAKASEIEVRFVEESPSATRVEFEHRGINRHGDGSDAYRAGLDAAQGWPYILGRYTTAVG